MLRKARHNGGDVTGPGADFENAVLAMHVERFEHTRDEARLAHGLPARDGQRQVALGEVRQLMRHEHLARDGFDRAQNVSVADALRAHFQKQRGAVLDGGVLTHPSVIPGGEADPESRVATIRGIFWIPAFAGMTIIRIALASTRSSFPQMPARNASPRSHR